MTVSPEARWRWCIVVLPLAMAVLLLGRVWPQQQWVIGTDQFVTARLIGNAGHFLLSPGSGTWAWPVQAPGCLDDHILGLALLMLPWQALGLSYLSALWVTTAVSLALNGTLLAVLLRRWGLGPVATTSAAVLAVGLPVFVQRLEHTNNLGMFWLLLWTIAFDAWLERRTRLRFAGLVLAGLGVAIMPATVLQWSALTLPPLALITVIRHWRGWQESWRPLVIAAGAHLPMAALALWIYLPYSHHSYPPNIVIPSPVQDLLHPLTLGEDGPRSDSLATPGPVVAVGIIGLAVALAVGRLRLIAGILLAVIVVNMLCAVSFGSWSPVDALRGLPLFGGMRSPARFAIPAEVLAVAGVALLVEFAAGARRPRLAVGIGVALLVAQMAVDGGPVVPLRLLTCAPFDVRAAGASARPGPVLALPTGLRDDLIGLATGRVTVGTTMGRPTDWQTQLNAGDAETAARTLVALQRLGMAAVVTDDARISSVLTDILGQMGGRPLATATPGLTWWELPPADGQWPSEVILQRIPGPGWRLTIAGEPGAAPIEGRVRSGGTTWYLTPFLPGTRVMSVDLPGTDLPHLQFSRAIPVRVDDGGH